MKKFITECGLFFALMLAIFITALTVMERDPDMHLYGITKKIEGLRTVEQPRIIFVGGSNLVFGLDSKTVSDSLHTNVINNGLNAGLGLKFMLDDIDEYLLSGDTVVISPEYNHFIGRGAYGEKAVLAIMAEYRPEILKKCNFTQIATIVRGLPNALHSRMDPLKRKIKRALGLKLKNEGKFGKFVFNEYGDEVSHWTLQTSNKPKITFSKIPGSFNESAFQYLIAKIANWERRGICVMMMPPAIYDKHFNANIDIINYITKRLSESGHPFIVEPSRFAYPLPLMYDTYYHINKEGADRRTQDAIEAIKRCR